MIAFTLGIAPLSGLCVCAYVAFWISSVIAVKPSKAHSLTYFCRLLYRSRPGIETRFIRFTRRQQNFCKWLLTREKRENKYHAKITNHTVTCTWLVEKIACETMDVSVSMVTSLKYGRFGISESATVCLANTMGLIVNYFTC